MAKMTLNPGALELSLVKIPAGFVPPMELLDPAQQSRARLFSGKRLTEFSASRLLLAHSLGADWCIQERDNTAPLAINKIDKSQRLMSLSHSNGWVVVAISPLNSTCKFGVDIEKIRTNWSQRKARFFCNSQQIAAGIALKSEAEQDHFFTALWTQKEAYFKATHNAFVEIDFKDDKRMNTSLLENNMVLSVYCEPITKIKIQRAEMVVNKNSVSFLPLEELGFITAQSQ